MKPQDVGFVIILAILLLLRREKLFVISGLLCFLFAIPLFAKWIFFTGERLVWYGAAFVFIGIILMIVQKKES